MQGSKDVTIKDGLSEESVVFVLHRLAVTNLARLYLVAPTNWMVLASRAFEYLRQSHPVLVGGYVGARQGTFSEISMVFLLLFLPF